jgi:hypothetical protein
MRLKFLPLALIASTALFGAAVSEAGTAHGTVNNATTGKPAGGVEVILIALQGSMKPVANTKSDAQGQFSFDNPGIGAGPMLIRAVYKGVMFHKPLPPGTDNVSVDVYEPSQDPKTVTVTSHVVIFQPNGSTLTVGEEYAVQNSSRPPVAYFRAAGSFQAVLPGNSSLKQIAAAGPSGMPVIQAPIEDGKGKYSIAYAFQPGESNVRLSYDLPYPNDSATVQLPTVYGNARLIVVAPPSVKLSGDGLQPSGQEQGMSIYERDGIPAGTTIAVNLSGTAPPLSSSDASDSNGHTDADSGQEGQQIRAVPGKLDTLKIPLLIGFAGLFALGAFLLARKPVAVTVAVGAGGEAALAEPKKLAKTTPPQKTAAAESPNLGALDAAANQSLDGLKDMIFRLELRRQAGTISEEEYAQERARAEKVLRDLVRG